jgi:hypothetical protein
MAAEGGIDFLNRADYSRQRDSELSAEVRMINQPGRLISSHQIKILTGVQPPQGRTLTKGECPTAIRCPSNLQDRHDYVHLLRQGRILPNKPAKNLPKRLQFGNSCI